MHPRRPTALSILASALLCAACTPAPAPIVETRLVERHVPPALLTCTATLPLPDLSTDRAVGAAYVAVWDAWQDCGSKLHQVRALLQGEGALGSGAPPSP
ncbi:MAG: hypothetical protein RIB84_23965 [Sneathiellaceae bacterium]